MRPGKPRPPVKLKGEFNPTRRVPLTKASPLAGVAVDDKDFVEARVTAGGASSSPQVEFGSTNVEETSRTAKMYFEGNHRGTEDICTAAPAPATPRISYDQLTNFAKIGRGTFGDVFRVQVDSDPSAVYALKRVTFSKSVEEVKNLKWSKKPKRHLVVSHTAFWSKSLSQVCILMEYMPYGSLKNYVARNHMTSYGIHIVAISLLDALFHLCSRHLVHRDVKPANILIGHNGVIKLADFGISRVTEKNEGSLVFSLVGSENWMAPERLQGTGYSYPSDVYSFGLVLGYLALGGSHPLPSGLEENRQVALKELCLQESHQTHSLAYDETIDSIIWRTTSMDAADRPTAKALLMEYSESEHFGPVLAAGDYGIDVRRVQPLHHDDLASPTTTASTSESNSSNSANSEDDSSGNGGSTSTSSDSKRMNSSSSSSSSRTDPLNAPSTERSMDIRPSSKVATEGLEMKRFGGDEEDGDGGENDPLCAVEEDEEGGEEEQVVVPWWQSTALARAVALLLAAFVVLVGGVTVASTVAPAQFSRLVLPLTVLSFIFLAFAFNTQHTVPTTLLRRVVSPFSQSNPTDPLLPLTTQHRTPTPPLPSK